MREPNSHDTAAQTDRRPVISEEAVARAQEAVDRLSARFDDWMMEEVRRMSDAWFACETAQGSDETLETLHRCAHDLKGLGPTCGYPLIGELGAELCRLTGPAVRRGEIIFKPDLVREHAEAVQIALAARIRSAETPDGSAMLSRLAARRTLAR
jgi:chemotaxis protein histidine kinase CheA